jgi:hypothetical protein
MEKKPQSKQHDPFGSTKIQMKIVYKKRQEEELLFYLLRENKYLRKRCINTNWDWPEIMGGILGPIRKYDFRTCLDFRIFKTHPIK